MNVTITVNVWFLISLCLICTIIGMLLNRRARDDRRY